MRRRRIVQFQTLRVCINSKFFSIFIVSNFCHPLFLIHSLTSGFHPYYSTKTARVKVTNGRLIVKSHGSFSTRILNYQQHLMQRCSISSTIIFLFLFSKVSCSLVFPPTSQRNFVSFARPSSPPQTCNAVVWQGSVLSHVVLSIHVHPLGELIWSHGFKCHPHATSGHSSLISPLHPRHL